MDIRKLSLLLVPSFLLASCKYNCTDCGSGSTFIGDSVFVNAEEASNFTVSRTFADHMVIQRNQLIKVNGFADESENDKKVTADFMGMHSEAKIIGGEWEITFPHGVSASSDTSNTLKIKAGEKEVVFNDVLVGDVFMVVGQSNVAYCVDNHWASINDLPNEEKLAKGSKEAIDAYAPIRINYNSLAQDPGSYLRGTADVLKEPTSPDYLGWEIASPDAIAKFSAYGYYFAYNYLKETNNEIPVGLIEIDGNGQPLGAFLSNFVAEETQSDHLDDWGEYYVPDGMNADMARYLYNEFMYPFERYSIAGLIWYQGESDLIINSMNEYQKRFKKLIEYMRSTRPSNNFPVYIAEFPTIYKEPTGYDASINRWQYLDTGCIRGVVSDLARQISNSYLVVTSDLWKDNTYWNNLHPNCKFEQGARLAKIVSAVNENKYSLDEALAPQVKDIVYSNDDTKVTLTFNYVGSGLKTSDGSDIIKGFKGLSYLNNPNIDVEARITGKDTVEITANQSLSGIAYNIVTTNVYGVDINLCDSFGNPAGAFMINK